ncbi:MAG: sugar phosphate isomerase/epimerase [Bacteroidales bacterium]|nr:sugar phosphate isomerase/epimerase [Bacteroidales bacterium]MCB9012748.1 sugar phosphate isomerase/epimerase [Bacteroidales bacterium]
MNFPRCSKGLIFLILCLFSNGIFAQAKLQRTGETSVKLSLNAYSFNDALTSSSRETGKQFSLMDLLDFCAANNIPALDPTGYYFPGYPEVPADEYIYAFKRKAFLLGIEISGTGIRNNFASPDPAVRAADVELAKKWIVVASKLGAPVIRLFAGPIPAGYEDKWDEVAGWMVDCYRECAEYGKKYGVMIGIQNHGDMLQTADQCIKLIEAVNSEWVGLILDTGNFKVEDPYADIEKVIPYTINFQLKESVYGNNSDIKIDLPRFFQIIKRSGYRGYIPIETLVMKGRPYDPFVLVPQFLNQARVAMNAEFYK